MKFRQFLAGLALFAAGTASGAYLFLETLPRSFLAIGHCGDRCFAPSKIAALAASVGIQRLPGLVPLKVMESDTCLAIRYPRPEARVHYVLFPKHDTRDITTLTPADAPYVLGCFALARELVAREHLRNYWLRTNGPDLQEINYLHFHLLAR